MDEQLINDIRWHSQDTRDDSDYGGMIPRLRLNWWQRLLGRRPPTPIPPYQYHPQLNQTACFFDVELSHPLPLGEASVYWGHVDSVIHKQGIQIGDGWPLPAEVRVAMKPLIGYHFRVINPTTILLSCWVDGQPQLDAVFQKTRTLLGLQGVLATI